MNADDENNVSDLAPSVSLSAVLGLTANATPGLLSEFLAFLSHEMHTPLNAILGFSEFLIDEKPGPLNIRQKEYLNDILAGGRQLLLLIDTVVELSKLEAGQIQVVPTLFDLSEAISEAVAAVAQNVLQKGICVRTCLAPQLAKVRLDRGMLLQILRNLLINATQSTAAGGEISITVDLQDTAGLRLIFEYPAGGIRHGDFHMALTRKLIEIQQGLLTIGKEVGSGSIIRVFLPWRAPTAVMPANVLDLQGESVHLA
jgi:signal transduction histidine kinase